MIKDKIKKLNELKDIIASAKRKGSRAVFTNGCFDLLHLGHIKYLEQAATWADILIVAVNSDASVRKIKGRGRPIVPEKERASLVAALECVDYVTIFTQDTPLKLIKILKPDVLVKGSDWRSTEIVGREVVLAYGGKVICANFVLGYSTNALIAKIKRVKCKKTC